MAEISNKFLAFVVVLTIGLSVLSTTTLLNKISILRTEPITEVTGKASTDNGNVSLRVTQDLSIILNTDLINFGSGFVNETNDPTNCGDNATLTVETGSYTNRNQCWTNWTASPTPFEIENNGNVNVTLDVKGPTSNSFFGGFADAWLYFKSSEGTESGVCPEIALNAAYQEFSGSSDDRICDNMAFTPVGADEMHLHVQVVIPAQLDPGAYSNGSIEFTAGALP